MLPLSVMALFCEDIREEKGDIVTLVGILPDTVNFEEPPNETPMGQITRVISKLCIYARVNFDPTMDLGVPQMWLVMPDGERLPLGDISSDIVGKSKSEAANKGNLLAGIVSRIVLAGFRPPNGSVKLEVEINGETHLGGTLLFKGAAPPPSISASVTLPPS